MIGTIGNGAATARPRHPSTCDRNAHMALPNGRRPRRGNPRLRRAPRGAHPLSRPARRQRVLLPCYYDLLRAGRPLAEMLREAVRIHAPYTHVPYHERIDEGFVNFVNNDHCLLSARATLNPAPWLPGAAAGLPMAQTIWYIPAGLDIWNRKINQPPGHYARGMSPQQGTPPRLPRPLLHHRPQVLSRAGDRRAWHRDRLAGSARGTLCRRARHRRRPALALDLRDGVQLRHALPRAAENCGNSLCRRYGQGARAA